MFLLVLLVPASNNYFVVSSFGLSVKACDLKLKFFLNVTKSVDWRELPFIDHFGVMRKAFNIMFERF